MVVNYVTKKVETVAPADNKSQSVVKFVKKNIFTRFGIPHAVFNDYGVHFDNSQFRTLLAKYGVKFRMDAAYHPQTRSQVEVFNRKIK